MVATVADSGNRNLPRQQMIVDVDGPKGHAKLIEFEEHMGHQLPRTFTCVSGNAEPESRV